MIVLHHTCNQSESCILLTSALPSLEFVISIGGESSRGFLFNAAGARLVIGGVVGPLLVPDIPTGSPVLLPSEDFAGVRGEKLRV